MNIRFATAIWLAGCAGVHSPDEGNKGNRASVKVCDDGYLIIAADEISATGYSQADVLRAVKPVIMASLSWSQGSDTPDTFAEYSISSSAEVKSFPSSEACVARMTFKGLLRFSTADGLFAETIEADVEALENFNGEATGTVRATLRLGDVAGTYDGSDLPAEFVDPEARLRFVLHMRGGELTGGSISLEPNNDSGEVTGVAVASWAVPDA